MVDAGGSRKFVPQTWRASLNPEESRAYLQDRLVVLSSRMFWSFVIFLVYIEVMYALYPSIRPASDRTILLGSAIGLTMLLVVWLGFLRRKKLAIATLDNIDLLYSLGTGVCFALGAYLAVDFKPAPYTCLLFTSLMVLTRAILLPSSGRRTLVMSIIAFAPFVVVGAALTYEDWADLPTPAIVGSVILIFGVVTLLAVSGSEMVYGLRQKASVAQQLGQYTLERRLAEGGFGVIWLANHVLLRRPTAVKLLHPDKIGADIVDRFEREVQHMSQLTHPNNVAIYDYGRNYDGVFYYAMEYLDGIDLEDLVRDFGPLPYERVVAILAQVCGALDEAHTRRFIHRDIKPKNIVLCTRGNQPDVAKVVDYGLVQSIDSRQASEAVRRDLTLDNHSILGTPGYIAPETIKDPAAAGPASDLYAIGATGYFLLTGKQVFEGETAWAIFVEHASTPPRPPSAVTANPIPPELDAIILGCLAKEPAARPANALVLAGELATVPVANAWNRETATAWWRDFQTSAATTSPTSQAPGTATMKIDLAHRLPEMTVERQ